MDEKTNDYYALTTTLQAIIHSPHDLDVDKLAQLHFAIPRQVHHIMQLKLLIINLVARIQSASI